MHTIHYGNKDIHVIEVSYLPKETYLWVINAKSGVYSLFVRSIKDLNVSNEYIITWLEKLLNK